MGESKKSKKARKEVWCSDEDLVVRAMAAIAGAKCPGCGFALEGLEEARCPECGRKIWAVVRIPGTARYLEYMSMAMGLLIFYVLLINTADWVLFEGGSTFIRDNLFAKNKLYGWVMVVYGIYFLGFSVFFRIRRCRRVGLPLPIRYIAQLVLALLATLTMAVVLAAFSA